MSEAGSGDIEPTIESEVFSREIDFCDRDLRGRDFSGDCLRNANFSGADLRGCHFVGTDLSEANFQGAKIGADGYRVWILVISDVMSVLFYTFLFFLLEELMVWLRPGSVTAATDGSSVLAGVGNINSDRDSTTDDQHVDRWVNLKGTGITAYVTVGIFCLLIFLTITSCLFLGYVNSDSIDEAYILIPIFLAIASVCLTIAITKVRNLSQTDFSGANLDLAQIDRSSFQTAKTSGAAIDRTSWL
jgi:uncharacterized protein YjbI with pentapeptide repeats